MATYRERAVEAYRTAAARSRHADQVLATLATVGCDDAVVESVDQRAGTTVAVAADGSARFVVTMDSAGPSGIFVVDDAGNEHAVASVEDVGRVLAGDTA